MCQNSIREVYWQEHDTRFESVFFQVLTVKEVAMMVVRLLMHSKMDAMMVVR